MIVRKGKFFDFCGIAIQFGARDFHRQLTSHASRIIAASAFCFLSATASAGVPEGVRAYDQGNYAEAIKELTPLADHDDANAQNILGLMYWEGKGVAQDAAKAVFLWKKASDQNNLGAFSNLAEAYAQGKGVPQDGKISASYFCKAFDLTSRASADPSLVAANAENSKLIRNLKLSHTALTPLFLKAAEDGDACAQFAMFVLLLQGTGIAKDQVRAHAFLQKSAENDYPTAQLILGLRYMKGDGIKEDPIQALIWIKKAADAGHPLAVKLLRAPAQNATKTNKSGADSDINTLKKAAEAGDAAAQNQLGNALMDGKGIEPDRFQAVAWYRKSAEQGNVGGQMNLGFAYYKGLGVGEDIPKAKYWLEKAARQGQPQAQLMLADLLEKNLWLFKLSYADAVAWYRKAAEQGVARAQTQLGRRLYFGTPDKSIIVNKEEGLRWLEKAAAQGDDEAKSQLGLINMNKSR